MTASARKAAGADDVSRWRNIGIVAHINAGKTTLTERILFDTGRQRFCGDVDSGTATTDWQADEQERGISIEAAVTDVPWRGHRIQLVDTPGHVDFAAEVERSLRVLDGAVVVIDGVRGVEAQTESVWRLLDRVGIPRLVFVNKLDRPSASFERAVASMRDALGCRPVPICAPLCAESGALGGLLDVLSGRFACDGSPAPTAPEIEAARAALIDVCGDLDEAVMREFVETGAVAEATLHAALRAGTLAGEVVPVFCGSALQNRGVEPLLDGICRYLPSPIERLATLLPDAAPEEADATVAFVFKVGGFEDGQALALARVFRGALEVGARLESGDSGPVAIRELFAVHAVERTPVTRAGPGAIVGVVADRILQTGETLRRPGTPVALEPIRFSAPVLASRIEPRTDEGAAELERAATALAGGDPTLQIGHDPETGALVVSGMGELHLDVFRARLERRVGGAVRFGAPTVVRYQTVASLGEGAADCARHLGERHIRAGAEVRVEPAPERGVSFRWAVSRPVPDEVRDEVLRELSGLALTGWHSLAPVRDLAIEVRDVMLDGPPEMTLPLLLDATMLACRRALQAGGPVEIVPWVRFFVATPSDVLSVVLADLRARGARIEEVLPELAVTEVRGTAPLGRLVGYATPLRSMTRGKASFELLPAGLLPEPAKRSAADLDREEGDR